MDRITVFCGSSSGFKPIYKEIAYKLGCKLAANNIELVYGGAKVGLMGAVADGVLDNSGHVIGVLPYFLRDKEVEHKGLSEIILVDTMHERKAKMNELCDGVIALPGGFGTLEELFEMLTWAQLSLHKKPIGILDIDNYYENLLLFIDKSLEEGFLKPECRKKLLVNNNIDTLLTDMAGYEVPSGEKWFEVK